MLEKAWAKVKGNYMASEAGYTASGLRALTGVPVFYYSTSDYSNDEMWTLFEAGNNANYLMGAGTSGGGDDSIYNSCGIAESHAYSVVETFTMTDAAAVEHKMLLIRNPWGSNGYTWTWNPSDENWTQDLIDQVVSSAHGFDPVNTS